MAELRTPELCRHRKMEKMWYDEIGRIFCDPHRKEQCHICGYDFDMMNRQIEIDKGLRKPPSEIETLAEQQNMILKGIKFMKDNGQSDSDPNMAFHLRELKKVEKKLAELRAAGNQTEIADSIRAAKQRESARDAEMAAIASAWAQRNPGKTSMEFGGAETQELYDQFASVPPSAAEAANRRDNLLCGYCGKSSATKLLFCSRCRAVSYCDKECQKAAWKGHKKICKPYAPSDATSSAEKTAEKTENSEKAQKKEKLPLTWEQLEAFGTAPAQGRVLEIRVMSMNQMMRQVFTCKDRVGAVRTVAAYTDSRTIAGAAPGRILRWRNPRFHYFMDGSSGARLEQEDLPDITVSST